MRNAAALTLALALGATACLHAAGASAKTVAFDWFEYSGDDPVFAGPLPAGHYRNPILAGFYPDPSVCRVGDDYYLINSTFAYFPGIPIFHSRDLVHWTQLGTVISRPEQLNYDGLGVSRGIFAPAISHHDGVFYVVCTMVDAGGNFLVTATDPAGPWSDPVWLEFDGIDPSIFFDADGRAWLVNNGAPEGEPRYSGHRAIWEQEFDFANRKLVGPRRVIVDAGANPAAKPVWIEGPHLFKRDDWYYLCCAEGGTAEDHSQVIFRAKSVTGPFVPWERNPILTQRDLDGTVSGAVTSTGHADLFVGPDDNWWAVFLGCRPFDGRYYATGRETFMLPVTWTDDGWPIILPRGERVPSLAPGPRAVAGLAQAGSRSAGASAGDVPLTGNFTWREDFATAKLSPLWLMLRRPHETWWQCEPDAGQLVLAARADQLAGTGNPSYLGRRVQHAHFEASAGLNIPSLPGISGGLVIFQNETHHIYAGVRRTPAGAEVFLERHVGGPGEVVARAAFAAGSKVRLRLRADGAHGQFGYSVDDGKWKPLFDGVDLTQLTTQAAGGFVGATVGIHARQEE